MDEQEKEKVSKVFTECWQTTRKYCFVPLDDKSWEAFCTEMECKSKDFRAVDKDIWMLYRGIMGAVQDYKIVKEKERKNGADTEVRKA